MLPLGHLSFSYLISQLPRLKRKLLAREEILFILFCGVVFDLDIFLPSFLGLPVWLNHHFLFTHTPLFGLFVFFIFYLLFKKRFSSLAFFLGALAIISHLVLDDIGFLANLLGWELQKGARPQIFWFYPFDPRIEIERQWATAFYRDSSLSLSSILRYYLFEARTIFLLEIILSFVALVIFVKKGLKTLKGDNEEII